jgi:Xaa-Pro aminopeptidase
LRGVARLEEIDGPLNALRAKKSSREIHLISRAADAVGVAFEAFSTARKAGAGARTAAIAAERAGFAFGAQQFGILASAKPGGPPLPLDGIEDRKVDPMLVYIAVRYAGYWSDGLVTVSDKPTGASSPTNAAIDAILMAARTGASGSDLLKAANSKLGSYKPHPILKGGVGNAIGLALNEAPSFSDSPEARLEDGGVYSLQVGADGADADSRLSSVMVAIQNGIARTLWRAPA